MKIIKPQYAFRTAINFDGVELLTGGAEVMSFLRSLPAEFEIVQPGEVAVKWPSDCTKGHLEIAARNLSYNAETSEGAAKHMLRALAAIAPVEKKKRKVWLWEKDHPHYTERSWTSNDIDRSGGGWRKVGECEVSE